VLSTAVPPTVPPAAGDDADANSGSTSHSMSMSQSISMPAATTSADEEEVSAETATMATSDDTELCSCSPTELTLDLDLTRDCSTDDVEGSPGIGLVFCFLSSVRAALSRNIATAKVSRIDFNIPDDWREKDGKETRDLGDTQITEVISVQFLEFDTTGTLLVINQDDTYEDVNLVTGDAVTFQSVSGELDPDEPISDQLDKVPGGAQLTLRGQAVDDATGLKTVVSVRLTWSYTNSCNVVPLAQGMKLGWVTFGELAPAAKAFCPVTVGSPPPVATPMTDPPVVMPTTPGPVATSDTSSDTDTPVAAPATDAPVATSVTPSVSDAPVAAPVTDPPVDTSDTSSDTGAPVAAPATDPPVDTSDTSSDTDAPVAAPATNRPVGPTSSDDPPKPSWSGGGSTDHSSTAFSGSKSSKSKTMKESPIPKAHKSYKDPQAKVAKSSKSHHDETHHGLTSSHSTKSGKALVDMDAKAEKATGSYSYHSKSAKKSKSKSSKGSKFHWSSDKSGKHSKSHWGSDKDEGSLSAGSSHASGDGSTSGGSSDSDWHSGSGDGGKRLFSGMQRARVRWTLEGHM